MTIRVSIISQVTNDNKEDHNEVKKEEHTQRTSLRVQRSLPDDRQAISFPSELLGKKISVSFRRRMTLWRINYRLSVH